MKSPFGKKSKPSQPKRVKVQIIAVNLLRLDRLVGSVIGSMNNSPREYPPNASVFNPGKIEQING